MEVRALEAPTEGEEHDWEFSAPQAAPPRRSAAGPSRTSKTSQATDGPTIETHFDGAAIEAVVARNRARLLGCIRAQAEGDPSLRGELPLSFVVGNDGRVARLWVDRVGYRSGPLHDCLLGELRRWEFPRFEGQRPAISLRFRVGG